MLLLRGIRKYFNSNGVEALGGADFELRPGEIHALVGENGAGKSTLMHIAAGLLMPSAGSVQADQASGPFSTSAEALAAGIGMVRQHPQIVPGFKVWEYCILGAEPGPNLFLDRRGARRMVEEYSCRWGFDLPVDKAAETMTVSQRQKSAILSLLLRNSRYIILDEPTAVLTRVETDRLFQVLRGLRSDGKGIALISHKLGETLALADRVTVLRRGITVALREAGACDPGELASLMFGTAPDPDLPPPVPGVRAIPGIRGRGTEAAGPSGSSPGPALRIRSLSVRSPGRPHIRDLSLELSKGRVLGVAGVRDSGLETMELAVAGFLAPDGGEIELFGKAVGGKGPAAFRAAGGSYLSADRTGTALALQLPLRDSLIVHSHRRSLHSFWGFLGFLDLARLEAWTRSIMEDARVVGSPWRRASSFSGGTLQRVILAREFAEEEPLMVLAEPGWGLDAQGRALLASRIHRFAASGGAVLLFSTDVDELLSLADEILVLRDGMPAGIYAVPLVRNQEDAAAPDGNTLRELIAGSMIGSEVCVDPA